MTKRSAEPWNFEDDPRLTAYALGELPAVERAEIETLLVGNAAAQRFVDETCALAAVLGVEMSGAPAGSGGNGGDVGRMTEPQRVAVRAAVVGDRVELCTFASTPPACPIADGAKVHNSTLSPARSRPRIFRVENWAIPARIAAVALVAVAFAQRQEIGEWWTGERVETSRFPGYRGPVGQPILDDISTNYLTDADDYVAPGRFREAGGVADASQITKENLQNFAGSGGGGGNSGHAYGYGGGGHAETDPNGRPSSRAFFNNNSDGDYRARTENVFDQVDRLSTLGYIGGGGRGAEHWNTIIEKRRALAGPPKLGVNLGGGGGGGARLAGETGAPRLVQRSGTTATWGTDPVAGGRNLPGEDVNLDRTGELTTVELQKPHIINATPPVGGTYVDQTTDWDGADPRLRLLFSTRDEPASDAAVTINFLQTENLLGTDPRYIADFDVEVRRVVRIADPVARRAALVGIVHKAQARSEGAPASYAHLADNPFRHVGDSPLSTFGIDVDTASYANVRRFLDQGTLPPPGAVRIEEMVNYFPYRYAAPANGDPFGVQVEVAGCPWNAAHRLVRIGLKGREVDLRERPQSNLVFLLDVSGSMSPANRLPLIVQSMRQLVEQLDARDKVSIVVYAGAAGLVLPPTAGDQRATILGALDRLQAGGSTAGAAGIELAYKTAQDNFVPGGVNRVILATDGDFNVGVSDDSSLVKLIEEKARSKVFLSVLGVGDDNLQDAKMEQIADKGNGNYAYLDSLAEGRKVLVAEAAGTLMTIAKDVKLQIEFNPLRVAEYRLLGYENRVLATEDFANDKKDAGDMGSGHTVTALYEITPTTTTAPAAATEPLRYQRPSTTTDTAHTNELLAVKLRFKQPEGDVSVLREVPVTDSGAAFDAASPDFHFAASVAAFGMLLRGSEHKGGATYDMCAELAMSGLSFDPGNHRAEFVDLVRKAKAIATGTAPK